MEGKMRLLSFAVVFGRHFSTQASAFQKKSWGNNHFFRKKSKSAGSRSRAPRKPRVKLTDEQEQVLVNVRNGKSLFITGSAGTGKTFLLEHVIKELKRIHGRSMVYVTASTGVAAVALNGQTLHSFSGIGLGVNDEDYKSLLDRVQLDRGACYRWRKAKALVIDEISMVDAKTFDGLAYLGRALRTAEASESDGRKTWGGIQLIVSGDFAQLAPITKKRFKKIYAFEADCWDASFDRQVELTKVFRQSDSILVQLLQGIRKGEIHPDDLKLLEGCCSRSEPDPSAVRLFPRIEDVNRVNREKMKSLGQKIYAYKAQDLGEQKWIKQLKSGIAADELELCVGARVMLVKNKSPWRRLVNGTTGTVIELVEVSPERYGLYDMCSEGSVLPKVKFDFGLELLVEPETWVVTDGDTIVARRRQIPLILSWALSIHKCQGMSIDKLHVELARAFGYGMVYVAISRSSSLEGLSLSGLKASKIKVHPKVLEFYNNFNVEKQEILVPGNSSETDEWLQSVKRTV